MLNAIGFFELNTGAKIPSVGLGTWQASPGVVGDAVAAAVKVHCICFRSLYMLRSDTEAKLILILVEDRLSSY